MKYRLIKLYPSLNKEWKIGDTVTFSILLQKYTTDPLGVKSLNKGEVENYPEFWQEIIEYPIGTKVYNSQIDSTYTKKEDGWYDSPQKTAYTDEGITKAKHINVIEEERDYEILSFGFKYLNNGSYGYDRVLLSDGFYHKDGFAEESPSRLETLLNSMKSGYFIKSIKRLSDGGVFSIGDYIICENSHNTTPEPIIKIELNKEDNICLYTNTFNKNGISINKAIKQDYEVIATRGTKDQNIFSVKNISNDKIFMVGNFVRYNKDEGCIIWEIDNFFRKSDNRILARSKDNLHCEFIDTLDLIKKPLFTTEDGYSVIDENEKLLDTSDGNWEFLSTTPAWWFSKSVYCENPTSKNRKAWKLRENAQAYIDKNKPKYSELDMLDFAAYFKDGGDAHLAMLHKFKDWKLKNNK